MRPKTLVLVLALGVGILGCMIVLKAVLGVGPKPHSPVATPETNPAPSTVNTLGDAQITNIVATTPKEDQQTRINADLESLRDALTGEPGDPQSLLTITERLLSSDDEVRKAAVVTSMHLGDTNILPYLTAALSNIEDVREKAGILDAIDYFKLMMQGEEDATNTVEMTNSGPSAALSVGPTAGSNRPAGGK